MNVTFFKANSSALGYLKDTFLKVKKYGAFILDISSYSFSLSYPFYSLLLNHYYILKIKQKIKEKNILKPNKTCFTFNVNIVWLIKKWS